MRGQERLRLQFGRTPDSVFCSDPLHPRAARVLLLLLFTVEEHGEKERERERGGHASSSGTRIAGIFVWGYNAHVTYATLSPSLSLPLCICLSLSLGGSSTTRTQRSLSVAREPRPEQHGLVVVRSIIAPTDTRSSPPFFFPRKPLSSSSPLADTLSTTLPCLAMEVSARPCL